MVMPKLPFSLFDFKYIDKIQPILKALAAAAGVAIPSTSVYKVPDYKFALLLGVSINVVKTTGTALVCEIHRAQTGISDSYVDRLIDETIGTEVVSWPSQKTAASHTIGRHLCFMWPGDEIKVSQALTALETIAHEILIHRIEYSDPRYEK